MPTSSTLDTWGRPTYPPAARPICPPSHPHGQKRCLDVDACACETCESARDERRVARLRKDRERREDRPVTTRFTAPTKSAPSGPQRRPERLDNSPKAPAPVPGITHGTSNGYTTHRCRCGECRAAQSAYVRAWRKAKADGVPMPFQVRVHGEPVDLPDGKSHGTDWSYKHGKCRCEPCFTFAKKKRAARRLAKKAEAAS